MICFSDSSPRRFTRHFEFFILELLRNSNLNDLDLLSKLGLIGDGDLELKYFAESFASRQQVSLVDGIPDMICAIIGRATLR